MQIKLHANARTTPKVRAYIQGSSLSVKELSSELGVSPKTIWAWKKRKDIYDRSHCRHNSLTTLTPEEEEIIIDLRQKVRLSVDDITEVMHRCVRETISRSSVYRCLVRNKAKDLPQEEDERETKTFEKTDFGYVHIDLKHLTKLERKISYVFVAIERETRFVYVEIINNRDAKTISGCLERFLENFPGKVHTILTDNGSEFTDRFAVDKIGKEEGKPTGDHPFDRICSNHKILHKLTKPYTPQTNGMVERFNRRIADAIRAKSPVQTNQGKNKFTSHQERNTYILTFVRNYNNTRLCCLRYKTPIQMLYNHTKYNTNAGISHGSLLSKGQASNPFI